MPEIEFDAPLDGEGLEWIRVRIVTTGGRVADFVVQYETTLNGERLAVIRYDNHHGFCHRDRMDRRGRVIEKMPVFGSPSEVATLGEHDIKEHWELYRDQFLGLSK